MCFQKVGKGDWTILKKFTYRATGIQKLFKLPIWLKVSYFLLSSPAAVVDEHTAGLFR